MKTKYRTSQWLDTSEGSMAQEQATILYGVQANNGMGWLHCHRNGEPVLFKTLAEASAECDRLRASATQPKEQQP